MQKMSMIVKKEQYFDNQTRDGLPVDSQYNFVKQEIMQQMSSNVKQCKCLPIANHHRFHQQKHKIKSL